jgi:hypothetical protein
MGITDKKEVRELFKYPVLQAIARRRSRRLPIGYKIEGGMIKKDPNQKPVPLNKLEEAILCWSGAGITGAVTQEGTLDSPVCRPITSWEGRATGNPCNVLTTRLFFTNDSGVFIYDPKTPTKVVEIENEPDQDKIMTYYQKDCRKVSDQRLKLISAENIDVEAINNQTGTTLFIPVVDNVELYIWRVFFSIQPFIGYQFYDDIQNRPAGLQKWIDSGYLKGPKIGLASFEHSQRTVYMAPAYLMVQNMQLVAEAMGLGSLIFSGYTGEVMLGVTPLGKGLGFRSIEDNEGKLNPVGLDGFFESYCPPYYKNMNEAVDAFIDKVSGITSPIGPDYKGILPFKPGLWEKNRPAYRPPSKEQIEIVKAYCNYVYDTYGRLPVTFSSKTIPVWIQVHHTNNEYYENLYANGIITQEHKNHMKLWHNGEK